VETSIHLRGIEDVEETLMTKVLGVIPKMDVRSCTKASRKNPEGWQKRSFPLPIW